MKFFNKKIIFLTSLLTCGSLFGIVFLNTSCSHISKTINPFYSSFENNDPIALQNAEVISPININTLQTKVTAGPSRGYGTHTGFGYSGLKSFSYEARYINNQTQTKFSNYIYRNLNVIVGKDTEFSYKIFPNFADNTDDDYLHNLNFIATYASVDLLYNNNDSSTSLKSLAATHIKDINGNGLSPHEQGAAKSLFSYQWNLVKVNLSSLAGKHIHAITINYDMNIPSDNSGDEDTSHNIEGFIDDLSIRDRIKIDESSLTNYVDTRRGTDGHMDWSRGSTFPATCLPHGFNFYTPVQHSRLESSGDADWLYNYKKFNDQNNLPTLNAFAIGHEPAPWMHDYDQMQIMPQLGSLALDTSSEGRRLEYSHDNEIAHPDYYAVTFNNGLKTEITPSSHSAIFRFSFPNTENTGRIIFDSLFQTNAGTTRGNDDFLINNHAISGWVENSAWGGGNYKGGVSRMFIYGEFSSSNYTHGATTGDYDKSRQYLEFDLSNHQPIELKIATSFISQTQAQNNLSLEINNDHLNFDSLHNRATNIWNQKLNVLDISKSNATEEQKKIIYSNLYRLNIYPNESFENIGTNQQPIYKHVSSALPTIGEATDTNTNAQIFNGKTYVNNGFWDTYRTVWPLYCILYPNFTKELIDGFLYQYLEGGYVSRWSAPGYTDCMTGTSSDCAFANAYVNGTVTDINTIINIYKSGMADSFKFSSDPNVGRKGLDHSMYRGWTASSDIPNGENMLDWDFQGWINDYAMGQAAIKLSQDDNLSESTAQLEIGQTKQQIKDTGEYLLKRSENFTNLFWVPDSGPNANNVEKGFFRSRDSDGSWHAHTPPNSDYDDNQQYPNYDPREWGYEYVEASGWNFAFTPTYDIEGLTYLYGGQQNLISKLDEFFNTPETGRYMGGIPSEWGVYSFTRETRDIGLGECVMTNQPSHHIPYMYAEAGKPSKTQELTRDILHRLFVGSDIGQGYCGDEDNGEMSSWYILSMLGLYDLALGKNQYVITSPLLNNVTVNRDNGSLIRIVTDDNSGNERFIKSAKLDNNNWNDAHIPSSMLLNGNHTISYKMSLTPTSWAQKNINGSEREFTHDKCLGDTLTLISGSGTPINYLTDGDATTLTSFTSNSAELVWQPSTAININTLGLTSSDSALQLTNINVLGSHDGVSYEPIVELNNQTINTPFTEQIYNFTNDQNWQYYKLLLNSSSTTWNLSEIQFI